MNYGTDDLVGRLPRVDANPRTAARIREEAHALLRRGRSTTGRARIRAGRIYASLLEPALLLATVALTLSWAVSRVLYITGTG